MPNCADIIFGQAVIQSYEQMQKQEKIKEKNGLCCSQCAFSFFTL